MEIPFWRQPLPRNSIAGGSSETEGSVASSRINIQMKLQEKKQKQLAELKIIEEEIKQGKLSRAAKITHEPSLPRLPAPRSKKHVDIDSIEINRRNSSASEAENVNILLYQLQQQQKNENSSLLYNNFPPSSGIEVTAALTKFSHEILTNLNIGENTVKIKSATGNSKQPSASSTMTSTTSENENNSLTRQMVSTRKKILHHNLVTNNLSASPNRIGSPHYDPRPSAYNSLESKSKTDTNRSSNSKNENSNGSSSNVNTNSMEKEKNLASQLVRRQMAIGNAPEILLAPNHLDGNSHFYQHYMNPQGPKVPLRTNSNSAAEAANNFMIR